MRQKGWKDKIQEYIQEHTRRKRWYKAAAILAAAAVFVTGGLMIVPAVTMEKSPRMLECETDIHKHTDSCYDEEENLICGYADFAVHTHDSSCYGDSGTLICPLPEIQTHTHDDSCYREEQVLICGQEESQSHTHQGHIHSEACYEVSEKLICGQEESEPHTHGADCYDGEGNLVCGKEETKGHIHTEDCYEAEKKLICTEDTGCYDGEGNLACGKEETKGHTHTDDCYEIQKERICGKEEIILHTHSDSCYDEKGNLTCGMLEVKEHVHNESCIPKEKSDETSDDQSDTSWATVTRSGHTGRAVPNRALFADPRAETDSYDFSDNITGVTVERQENGQWVTSDTFTEGDNIRVTIRYTIPQGIIHEEQLKMHYQLPAGIALAEEESGQVSLENGDSVGTYTISTDGMISISFAEEFANGEAFSGNLHFQGSVTLADQEEDQEIQFGGAGGSITIKPEEKQYSLSIGKPGVYVRDEADAERYEQNNLGISVLPEHLIYTIEVRADEDSDGSDGTITVTDRFTHDPADGVVIYDENNIKIYKISSDVTGSAAVTEITDYNLEYTHQQTGTDDLQTSTFTITGLPALAPGERYSINYSASVDFDTVNSPNGYISVSNEASAEDSSRTVKATSNVEISRRMVHKEVSVNEGTGNVQWTVTLNEDGRDLSSMMFKDEMTYTLDEKTLTYNPENMTNLRVTAYEINDAGQQVSKGDVTSAFENLLKFENGKMEVLFPEAGEWPDALSSNWVYKIVYETPFPEGAQIGDSIAFSNTVRLDSYYETVNWNGKIPETGYGLVKRSTGNNLNTGTDTGTVNWQATISYPSADFELNSLQYMDWIPDVYYAANGQFIPDSHYTTAETLNNTLQVKNAAGEELVRGTDYTVFVAFAEDMSEYDTYEEAFNHVANIFAGELTELTGETDSDQHVALFSIIFTESSRNKLEGGQRLYISYQTLVDRQGVTDGELVNIYNIGAILGRTVSTGLQTSFHEQLQKQVSATGMAPAGDDFNLDSNVYTNGPVNIDLGDTGGKLYYRILFYNYKDTIEFHDDMLQKFNGKVVFDQQMRIYDTVTGEVRTVKTWDYLDSSGKYYGNYTLKNLGQFKDCIIGLYYSIDVSGDPELETLEDGAVKEYTNTVKWTDVGIDSTTAQVTNSESTLEKVSEQTGENGENLVYYYVTINPESRDLHPTSSSLELQDTLTISAGSSAILRPDTIRLYHYNAQNAEGHYLGEEVTEEEFSGFSAEKAEGNDNSYIFTVPDEMACVVVYAYEIDSGTSALEEITVNNTASLLGRAVISAGDQVKIQTQESGSQVNKATLTIYKIGGNDYTNLLQDVLFDLFRYEQQEDGSYSWVRTDLTAEGPSADGGGKHFITGGDGVEGAIILNFLDEEGEGQSSYYNTLYRLTEYETLSGYELDTTPRYYVWGQLGMSEDQTALEMADVLEKAEVTWDQVVFIPFGESKTEYINNESLNTSVTAVKQWLDADGTTRLSEDEIPESITLTLYQHVNGEKTQYGTPVDVTPDQQTGLWTYTWESLPRKDESGNRCTYSVEETAIAGESDMSGYEISYHYPDGESPETGIEKGEITITNTKIASYILPETGGTGAAPFITAGLFLAGMSGAGYLYIRKQKR